MVAERERRVVGGAVNLDGALGVTAGAEEEEIVGEAGEEGAGKEGRRRGGNRKGGREGGQRLSTTSCHVLGLTSR